LEIVEYIDSIDLYTVKIPEGRDARKIVETMIQDKDIAYAVSTISKCEFN
jgi:predicted DNA-binding protein with PD1-like motif